MLKLKLNTSAGDANTEPNHQKNPMARISPSILFTPEKSATEQIPMIINAVKPKMSPILYFFK